MKTMSTAWCRWLPKMCKRKIAQLENQEKRASVGRESLLAQEGRKQFSCNRAEQRLYHREVRIQHQRRVLSPVIFHAVLDKHIKQWWAMCFFQNDITREFSTSVIQPVHFAFHLVVYVFCSSEFSVK